MSIFIGGAWPYANGSLHIGHLAALLPGDVLARYYRATGEEVLYASGSDCHGTPIAIRAKQEKVSPREITDKYHNEFKYCFNRLGFTYDIYSRTDDSQHKKEVQNIIVTLFEKGFIYEKEVEQLYCASCNQYLPDRFVEGICPVCKSSARGDQCDSCSTILEPLELEQRKCKLCGKEPEIRKGKQLFLSLSKFEKSVSSLLEKNRDNWRLNAVNNTERYIKEGLKDRAISRDLDWGVDVPIEGYEDKKIYVWIDAVLGYLTASKKWGRENNKDWENFWNKDTRAYYVHGKDNIPFHSIILTALLNGIGIEKLPNDIIASEYVTLEGKKISTSNNFAVWLKDIIENYNVDVIRYFFLANGPEKRDADFSWKEFINRNNGELLGSYGNLVNRTLVFVRKNFDEKIPEGVIDSKIKLQIEELYIKVGELIKVGNIKTSLEIIFEFIRSINKYFDENAPWITINTDKAECGNKVYNCLVAIVNIANLLQPFLPFSSNKVKAWLGVETETWNYKTLEAKFKIKDFHILFERLDKDIIEIELNKLKNDKKTLFMI